MRDKQNRQDVLKIKSYATTPLLVIIVLVNEKKKIKYEKKTQTSKNTHPIYLQPPKNKIKEKHF